MSYIFTFNPGSINEHIVYFKDKGCTHLHREDGPAIEFKDGTKEWYKNNKRHRKDGPAIEWAGGDKAWLVNGKLHREDGPAIEYINGVKCYYLNGEQYSEEEYLARIKLGAFV